MSMLIKDTYASQEIIIKKKGPVINWERYLLQA